MIFKKTGVGVEGRSDPGKVRKGFQFQTSQWMNGKTIQHCPQPITAVQSLSNTVTAVQSLSNTVTAVQSLSNTVTAVQSLSNTVTAVQSLSNTVTAVQSLSNTVTAVQSLSNTVTAVQSLPTLSTACYSCTVPFQHCYSYTVFFQHCYSCSLFPTLLQLYSLFPTLSTACYSVSLSNTVHSLLQRVSFHHCPLPVTAVQSLSNTVHSLLQRVSFQHCPQLVTACLFPTLPTAEQVELEATRSPAPDKGPKEQVVKGKEQETHHAWRHQSTGSGRHTHPTREREFPHQRWEEGCWPHWKCKPPDNWCPPH